MLVSFWGNYYHQTGVTYSAVALAGMTALEYRLKSMITHNHFNKSALEYSFLEKEYVQNDLSQLSDIGLDGLGKFIKFNKVDQENIKNFTTTLIRNKLEILVGTSITNKDVYYNDIKDVLDIILATAKSCYDVVFFDVDSGINELSSKVFEYSDKIIVTLSQNPIVLDDFFENYDKIPEKFREKFIFLIAKYDKNSRYNVKTIQRKYGIKDPMIKIPYSIEFADACAEGRAIDFLNRNRKADKDDNNYFFMSETNLSLEYLLKKLNVNIQVKKIGE